MPETKYYTIKQTRVVKVTANDEQGALAIANQAFGTGESEEKIDDWGHVLGRVEVTSIEITRDYI
jgi:sortase (surface protein transpeptidase)